MDRNLLSPLQEEKQTLTDLFIIEFIELFYFLPSFFDGIGTFSSVFAKGILVIDDVVDGMANSVVVCPPLTFFFLILDSSNVDR